MPSGNVVSLTQKPTGSTAEHIETQGATNVHPQRAISREDQHRLSINLRSSNFNGQTTTTLNLLPEKPAAEIIASVPMPGFMHSVFPPSPAKVAIPPQRNPLARAWDAFAGGVKGFFQALGQGFSRPVYGPDVPMPNFNSESKLRMKIFRSDKAIWKEVIKACEKGQSTDQLAVFTATEKFIASPKQTRSEFMKMSAVILRPNPKDETSQANIDWAMINKVNSAREAKTYSTEAANLLAQEVYNEMEVMIRTDYVNTRTFADSQLFAQGKKARLLNV